MKTTKHNIFLLIALTLFIFQNSFGQKLKHHRISAELSPDLLKNLFKDGLEIDHYSYDGTNFFSAELNDKELKILKKNKIDFKYEIEDLEKNLAKHNKKIDAKEIEKGKNAKAQVTTPLNFALGSYAGFYTFAEMQTILDNMRSQYPNLISAKSSIGTTVEGRPIFMVKISDNPDVDEAEPEMLFTAVHHAREPISMSQMIFTIWHLLENYNNDNDIKTLINSSEIYILPCVNPDGYVYNETTNPAGGGLWRKNRKNNGNGSFGIDLNRNYSFKWGFDNSGSSPTSTNENYRGTGAFSEPEMQVVRDFCNAHTFSVSLDYHAFGNHCIFPYGYQAANSNPELAKFQQIATFFTAENSYQTGNFNGTLQYLANGEGLDWKYAEQTTKPKMYAFLPEVGTATDGFWPALSRIIPLCNTTIEMNKKALKVATYFGKATPTGSLSLASTNGNLPYSFQNFSIKPTTYTVSITPISTYITSVGPAKTYTNFALLQSQADNISFSIDPATPIGTNLQFNLTVDNGLSPQTEVITMLYNCGTPSAPNSSAISATAATLNWGAVNGASNYSVEYKLNSATTWVIANAATTSTSQVVTGLNASSIYDWRVKSNCAIGVSNYATSQFTTLSSLTYCVSKGTNLSFMWLDKVNIGSINRTSAADGGYYNGTSISTSAARNSTQTIILSAGYTSTVYKMGFRVWIDYNQNGLFTDAGEQIVSVSKTTAADFNSTFTIPSTALTGPTRMRVSAKYNALPSSCETFTYGEVEDYTINITAAGARLSNDNIVVTENEVIKFEAYPNPMNDKLTVKFGANISETNRTLSLLTTTGKKIINYPLMSTKEELTIDTKGLSAGFYLLQLQEGKKNRILKVLKE